MKTKLLILLSASLALQAYAGSATWRRYPAGNDWNTGANWRPRTVPNGPSDTATFAVSDTIDVSLAPGETEVESIVFNPGASPFTITVGLAGSTTFVLTGIGVANNSGVKQNFISSGLSYVAELSFYNEATAGAQTVFTAKDAGYIFFYDETTAGSGTFMIEGTKYFEDGFSQLRFLDNSSAANGTFIITGGGGGAADGGLTWFSGEATAANGTFTNKAADAGAYSGGDTIFTDNSTAADGIFTNEGAAEVAYGGTTDFYDSTTAGRAIITCIGGSIPGAVPGEVQFFETSSAGNATLIANSGSGGGDGGKILFWNTSDGAQAQVKLLGNGMLDLSNLDSSGMTIGSLEGNGLVLLDTHNIGIGSNNLSTTFSGVISGSGSLTKTGTGILVLSGANSYTDGTTIKAGRLLAENRNGSATGTGAVRVHAGVLGGRGMISGAVTIGNGVGAGGYLAPGRSKLRTGTLTLESNLTFDSDASYACDVNSNRVIADKVVANGVTIGAAALFLLADSGAATLAPGTVFTVIDNTAATPIDGSFANLADGSTVTIGSNTFQANYEGGDGNDLTLTVVP